MESSANNAFYKDFLFDYKTEILSSYEKINKQNSRILENIFLNSNHCRRHHLTYMITVTSGYIKYEFNMINNYLVFADQYLYIC